jgi:hypothetical protein
MMKHTDPLLDRLTDMQISMESIRASKKTQATIDLINTYQKSLIDGFEYMRLLTAYERTENAASKNYTSRLGKYTRWQPPFGSIFTFGVHSDVTRAGGDLFAKDQLMEKSLLLINASLDRKLPEYRYANICHMTFSDTSKNKQDHQNRRDDELSNN